MGIFDSIMVLDESGLGEDFQRERGGLVRKYGRGYGLWSWKPYLIMRRLDAVEDGDLIMYADAGCSLNPEGRQRLEDYFAKAGGGAGWLSFSLEYPDRIHAIGEWTKRAVLRAYGQDHPAVRSRPQLAAGCHFIRASAATRLLARRWYDACGVEADLNDDISAQEHPQFIAHRHDQSIFSVLAMDGPVETIPDETWFEPDWRSNLRYPVHARRWKHRLPWPSAWLRADGLGKALARL
jgi:hypothetical protein